MQQMLPVLHNNLFYHLITQIGLLLFYNMICVMSNTDHALAGLYS
jgi:hypothetical protein